MGRRAGRRPVAVGGRAPGGESGDPLVGREVEVTIERIVPGGLGLAHAEGRTLFVALAAPGDRARIRLDRVQGRVAFGSISEVLEPSPARIEPPHPEAIGCGGADFQHLAYEAQLAAKVEIVRDCLRRIGGLEPPEELPIVPSPATWGYRSRAEWHIDRERNVIGYYELESHRVCPLERCPMSTPELNALLTDARRWLAEGSFPRRVKAIKVAAAGGETSVSPSLDGGEPAELVTEAAGERFAYDAESFFQVNLGLLEPLIAEALHFAEQATEPVDTVETDHGIETRRQAIDLYCGVGLFTLPLARRFDRVVGVESHHHAVRFARRNVHEAGLLNVRVAAMPVGRWLLSRGREVGLVALAVLDPPRTGIDPEALAALVRLRPGRIAYVACDPATLARDLKQLVAAGYRLERAAALDLFPQTHHVEAVAHLALAG